MSRRAWNGVAWVPVLNEGGGLAERLAREARLRNDGFIDCCHPQYCEAPATHPLCPTCEAIERVARHAIRAALDEAGKIARADVDLWLAIHGPFMVSYVENAGKRIAAAIEALR